MHQVPNVYYVIHCNILFICSLSDTTILDSVKDESDTFPQIGDVDRIDITICRDKVDDKYLIRMKQNGEKFETLEVHLTDNNNSYVFDCLNLERYLSTRLVLIYMLV